MKKSHHYRFFVNKADIRGDVFLSTDHSLVNQIKNVFRLEKGDQITVLDGTGKAYVVLLNMLNSDKIGGQIVNIENRSQSEGNIRLFCPLLKGENFEIVLKKCTETGVSEFHPVIYANSVVKTYELKARWQKLIRESSEQSMRFIMPTIFAPVSLEKAISLVKSSSSFVAYEEEAGNILGMKAFVSNLLEIDLFIGPEGGFSDGEINKMREAGFRFFSFGETVLRSETACILSAGIFSQFMLK